MKIKQKALLYCRVSSKSQEEDGHGLDSQEHRCREYAAAKGYEVVEVFPDTRSGGGDFMKRPGMVSLLAYLDAYPDENFVVIFDDLKRYARDTVFHLRLKGEMKLRNAERECLNFKFEDTPEGEFIETVMAAQGELERKQNGRQVAQKMKARMQAGYWVHKKAVGYRYQKVEGRGKMLVPDEPMASIVREGLEGRAIGRFQSDAEVKRYFESFPDFPRDRNGVLTQHRVTEILTQPLYTGYICSETYGIDWLKGHHEPLISLETFDKVQERRRGVAKAPQRKNLGDDFVMRGMAVCADCGVPLRSSWSTGRQKPYAYYLCQTKACESYGKSIPRVKLEGDIGELVRELEPTTTLFTITRAMFAMAWEQRREQAADIIRSGRRQVEAVEKQIESLLTRIMNASNQTVIRSYENKITELERSKLVLAEQLAFQAEPKGKFEEQLEPALTFLANPWKLWQTGNIALRRTVLRLAFAERIQYCRKEGPRTPLIALPFKALKDQTDRQVCFGAQKRLSRPVIEPLHER
ncbi:MAG: recombinase family protein [Rhizobiaceae bacterium]